MAYLLPIHQRECGHGYCSKKATCVLRNRFNEVVNWYCKKHGDGALKSLERAEKSDA